jgi:hypothetical protein
MYVWLCRRLPGGLEAGQQAAECWCALPLVLFSVEGAKCCLSLVILQEGPTSHPRPSCGSDAQTLQNFDTVVRQTTANHLHWHIHPMPGAVPEA